MTEQELFKDLYKFHSKWNNKANGDQLSNCIEESVKLTEYHIGQGCNKALVNNLMAGILASYSNIEMERM